MFMKKAVSNFNKIVDVLLYITLGFFTLGQLGRLSFLGQQVNVYLYEAALFLLTLILVLWYRLEPLKQINKKQPFILYFLGYLSIFFFLTGFGFTLQQNLVSLLYLLRLSLYFIFFSFAVYHYLKEKSCIRTMKIAIYGSIILTLILSFIQYSLYPNLRNISYLGWDPHWYRMVGMFFDPPIAGALYGLFFIFLYGQKKISQVLKIGSLAILSICIVLTYSRGTFLAILIVILVMFFKKSFLKGIVLVVLLVAAVYLFIPKPFGESVNLNRTFSIFSRVSNYQEGLSAWVKRPLIGVGYNRVRYSKGLSSFHSESEYENNHAGASYHSSFLLILVTGGIVGLLLYFGVLISFVKLGNTAFLSTVFLSLLSLTDNVLLHPFVLFFYSLVVIAESSEEVSLYGKQR